MTNASSSSAQPSKFNKFGSAGSFILDGAGVDPKLPGLVRTPERFAKPCSICLQVTSKQQKDVVGAVIFPIESDKGLVAVQSIEFYSLCEHHMLPFWAQ